MSRPLETDYTQHTETHLYTQSSFTFNDLQEIWNFQKSILHKFKNSQIPFVILDSENSGFLHSSTFPSKLVAKGFPHNKSLYRKFFAFLDTNNDGYITQEDWMLGFQKIGTHLVEARCEALENLKLIHPDPNKLTISAVKQGLISPPDRKERKSATSPPRTHWEVPKELYYSQGNIKYLSAPEIAQIQNSNMLMNQLNSPMQIQKNNGQEGKRLSEAQYSNTLVNQVNPSMQTQINNSQEGKRPSEGYRVDLYDTPYYSVTENSLNNKASLASIDNRSFQNKEERPNLKALAEENRNAISLREVQVEREPGLQERSKNKALSSVITGPIQNRDEELSLKALGGESRNSMSIKEAQLERGPSLQEALRSKNKAMSSVITGGVQGKEEEALGAESRNAMSMKEVQLERGQSLQEALRSKNKAMSSVITGGVQGREEELTSQALGGESRNSMSIKEVQFENRSSIQEALKSKNQTLSDLVMTGDIYDNKSVDNLNSVEVLRKQRELLERSLQEVSKSKNQTVSDLTGDIHDDKSVDSLDNTEILRKSRELLQSMKMSMKDITGNSQENSSRIESSRQRGDVESEHNISRDTKIEEVHRSIQVASQKTLEVVQNVLEGGTEPKESRNQSRVEASYPNTRQTIQDKNDYAPSITSIAAADEEKTSQKTETDVEKRSSIQKEIAEDKVVEIKPSIKKEFVEDKVLDKRSSIQKEIDPMEGIESGLEAKIMKKTSGQSSKVPSLGGNQGAFYLRPSGEEKEVIGNVIGDIERTLVTKENTVKTGQDVIMSKKSLSNVGSRNSVPYDIMSKSMTSYENTGYEDSADEVNYMNSKNASKISIYNDKNGADEERDLTTPNWKDNTKYFATMPGEEEDIVKLIEKLLEEQGGREEAIKMLKREDLSRFPHLQMLIKALEQEEFEQDEEETTGAVKTTEASRGVGQEREKRSGVPQYLQVKRRGNTRSLMTLKTRPDSSVEVERSTRRRARTPEMDSKEERDKSLESARRAVKSLTNSGIKKQHTFSQGIGGAYEVLDEIKIQRSPVKQRRGEEVHVDGRRIDWKGSKKKSEKVVVKPREYTDVKSLRKAVLDTLGDEEEEYYEMAREDRLKRGYEYTIKCEEMREEWKKINNKKKQQQREKEEEEENEEDKDWRLKRIINQLSGEVDNLEARASNSRLGYKRDIVDDQGADSVLWKMFRKKEEDRRQMYPGRTGIKTFLRNKPIEQSYENDEDKNCIDKYTVQDQLHGRLSKPRLVNKYSQLAADLGTFAVQVNKQPLRIDQQKSPLKTVQSTEYDYIDMRSVMNEEFTGKGKTYLISQFTRLDAVNKEFIQTSKSLKKAAHK